MPLVELTFKTLSEFDDGRIAKAVEHEIRRAVQDCLNRPRDESDRKVNLAIKLCPVRGEDGACEQISTSFEINLSTPKRKTNDYVLDMREVKGGQMGLVFSTNNPQDARQHHIDDVDPNTGSVRPPQAE